MAANVTVALGKELGGLKQEYDKLQKHFLAVEKKYGNLISSEETPDGEIPIATRLQLQAAQLFSNDMFSDITILLQGGVQVKAHKFVLAASGNDWGVDEFHKVDMLDLTDMRYEVCYALIKWLYTDEFEFHHKINDEFLIELMQAASICKLESLFIRCQKALSSILNNENCEKFLKISEELKCTTLKNNCIKILQEKQETLIPQQEPKVMKPVVKIIIPTPKKQISTPTKSNFLETQPNIKKVSGTENKKQTKTILKSIETAQSIEDSILEIKPQEKNEDSSPGNPPPSQILDSQPMIVKEEIECDDVDDNDDTWNNLDGQVLETPSVKDEDQLNHHQPIQDTPSPIGVNEATLSHTEESVVEEGQILNGNDVSDNNTKNPESETFTCDVCNKSFIKKDYLKKHKVIHEPFKPHQCPDCFKTFHNQGDLRKHIITHDKVVHQCDDCGKVLRSASSLEIHKATHLTDSGVQCKICGKYLRSKMILKNHMYIHTGEKKHKCDICDKSFRQSNTLMAHKKIHSGLRPYICEVCGKSFLDGIHLRRHKTIHINGKRFQCTKCEKSFKQKATLNKHYSTHGDIYRCDYCKKILLSVEEYQNHRMTHLPPGQTSDLSVVPEKVFYNPKPYCCEVCGKTFQNKSFLTNHMSVHTGERPFVCTVCNKTFRTKTLYKEHGTLHTGEQPFKCGVCGKAFRLYTTLSAHKNTHNTELSFICDVCGKGFTTAAYLKKHKVSHRPDKPHKCDLCGLGFKFASSRNVHRKDHDAAANGGYLCQICGKKGFQSRSWFNAHKKKCRETPRFCQECGIHFSRSHPYKQHMEKYGNINPHYHCSKCLTVFIDLDLLNNHDCTPKDRISCPYCPAVVMGRLKRHLESCHPGEVDPKGNHLTREQRRATAEKLTCPFCEVQVLSLNSLKRHIRIIHKDVEVAKVTRESVSIVSLTGIVEFPQKSDQEIVTQEVLDWNTIFP